MKFKNAFNEESRRYSCNIRLFAGVKDDVVQYTVLDTIYGRTKHEVISKVVDRCDVGWNTPDFFDVMYDAFASNASVSFPNSTLNAVWNKPEPNDENYGF